LSKAVKGAATKSSRPHDFDETSMASAERIQLMCCPGCRERVIPPPDSTGVWECPFCGRRFRRRVRSKASSGTIPCFNLESKHRWPPDDWRADRDKWFWHPARWSSLLIGAYAVGLMVLMVAYHVCMTVLACAWLLVRLPAFLAAALESDDEMADDRRRPTAWTELARTWLPYFARRDLDETIGPVLARDDAVGVFIVVTEMARRVGAAAPDEIRLTYLPCIGVVEEQRAGLKQRRRVLVLGLPLLYVLTIEELRAVVAHELAHLSRGDAAIALVVSQFVDSLDQSIAVGTESPWGWLNPCVLFAWLVRGSFRVLSTPLSHYQEHRADRLAAAACGGNILAGALEIVALVQPVFHEVLCHYHPVIVHDANLYEFFLTAWTNLGDDAKEEMKETLVADERKEWFSPHPTLRSRMRRLRASPRHFEPDDRPARRLLTDRTTLETVLHNYIYRARSPQLSVFQPV
jgi:Zn-dependent protease with chaperone function